ncbi:MAG: hypothetical protein N2053_06945, partial [Chitinispirillaceae bacterium]|nr:hypothetical protein [Chitinispirillaceae bacterium]
MKKIILLIEILLSVSLSLAQKDSLINLTFLYFNDFHGRVFPEVNKNINEKEPLGGAAYLAQMINEERGKNPDGTLLLAT